MCSSKHHTAVGLLHKQGGIWLRTMYRKLPRFGNLPSAVAAPLLQQLPNRTAVLAAARKVGQQLCCASNTPEHLSDHAEFAPACCRTLGHLTQHSTECEAERRQKHLPEHKLQHGIWPEAAPPVEAGTASVSVCVLVMPKAAVTVTASLAVTACTGLAGCEGGRPRAI